MRRRARVRDAGCAGALIALLREGLRVTGARLAMTVNRVAAVIPTLNEAETIAGTIASLPRDVVDEIIVADSSSRDGTAAIARAAGARVVTLAERGYGRACAAGAAAAGEGCGIILFLDGDGADRADLADMLVAPIRAGTHDFVIGSRVRGEREPGSMSWHQVLAGRLAGWLMSALYGVRYTDMCAFRAISREALARLDMRETDLWLEHRDADEGGARRPAHPGTAGAVPAPRRRQFEGGRHARRQRSRRLAHHR